MHSNALDIILITQNYDLMGLKILAKQQINVHNLYELFHFVFPWCLKLPQKIIVITDKCALQQCCLTHRYDVLRYQIFYGIHYHVINMM
jgi:hypothetical protein